MKYDVWADVKVILHYDFECDENLPIDDKVEIMGNRISGMDRYIFDLLRNDNRLKDMVFDVELNERDITVLDENER